MFRKSPFSLLPLFLLIAALALSGCSALVQPVTRSSAAPTPVVVFQTGGVDNPDVYVDVPQFQAVLLKALVEQDTEKLQLWMDAPFFTGIWRSDASDTPPAEVRKTLYAEALPAQPRLALVKDADLQALMSVNPLTIPGGEAPVVQAFLVSGWGVDGRDEAVLFISRWTDNSLHWRGWLRIPGGFSGARVGDLQRYQNDAFGYSLYLPNDIEVDVIAADNSEATFLAPGQGHPGETRAAAFLTVKPADGRTTEQVTGTAIADQGPGFNIYIHSKLNIEDAQALVVSGMPGQDVNRQLFMVHNNQLYHILFVPDNPRLGQPYQDMEELYNMIVNTLHFTE